MDNKSINFIDLFAGCGGLSLGLMSAGCKGLFAIEKDPMAFETLKHNLVRDTGKYRFNWPHWFPKEPTSIENAIKKYSADIKKLSGKVDLIAGGPPCQGFSIAGRRNAKDPRNKLVKKYIEFVSLVNPRFIIIENVLGITMAHSSQSSKPFSQYICSKLKECGYEVFDDTLYSTKFAIPQNRPRHVFIGIREDILKCHPGLNPRRYYDRTRDDFLYKKGLDDKPITVEQAISDLAFNAYELVDYNENSRHKKIVYMGPKQAKKYYYQHLLHVHRNGRAMNGTEPNSLRLANHRPDTKKRFEQILDTCEKQGRKGVSLSNELREKFKLRKHALVVLNERKPSHTITTLPDDILHYKDPRILTVRENARLQSFPDWFEFKGKYTTGGKRRTKECPRYTQVGNAVPPFLAEYLGLLVTNISKSIR